MSDFGDEVGSDLKEKSVRWLSDFLREMQRLRERRELMEQRTQHERGQCGMELRDNAQADAVMKALDARGIPYDVRRTSLGEYRDGELQRKISIQFDEKDFDAVEAAASAKLRELEEGARLARADLGKSTMSFDEPWQTQAVARALDEAGIPYTTERTSLGVGKDGALQERTQIAYPSGEHERVRQIVDEKVAAALREKASGERAGAQAIRSHDGADVDSRTTVVESVVDVPGDASATRESQNRVYTDEIAAKVEAARAGATTREEFAARCEAAGLGVAPTSDGELKFSHPDHPWFEVRADTLGEKYSSRSFGLRGKEPEDGEIGINLDRDAKEAREVSRGRAQERNMDGFERYIPDFKTISR